MSPLPHLIAFLLYFFHISSSVDSNYILAVSICELYADSINEWCIAFAVDLSFFLSPISRQQQDERQSNASISAEIFSWNIFMRRKKAVGVCLFAVVFASLLLPIKWQPSQWTNCKLQTLGLVFSSRDTAFCLNFSYIRLNVRYTFYMHSFPRPRYTSTHTNRSNGDRNADEMKYKLKYLHSDWHFWMMWLSSILFRTSKS